MGPLYRLLVIVTLLGTLTACAAAKATYHLVEADQALKRASDHQAQELAVYEYTMAIRFLEKAREEAGFADYKVSVNLAKQSAEWADKAIIVIEQGGRNIILDELDEVPEEIPTTAPTGYEEKDLLEEERDLLDDEDDMDEELDF
ncbi:MAG: DUF4398 domain-containing protein [Proteobacteria bacterium]|jgi:HEPN domain-containing protein|nr:DUF4398 domain-containing protein [Pseudomonadota bacterium]